MMVAGPRRPRLCRRSARTRYGLIGKANQTKGLAQVYTFFDTATPRIFADVDRAKADMLGVPPERVFEALQVYLGSAFVNDFNLLGRTYRVTAQADAPFRDTDRRYRQPEDALELGRDGADRIGRDLPGQDRAVPRRALQPVPRGRGRGRHRAGLSRRASRWRRWRSSPTRRCPPATASNGPASPIQQKAAGSTAAHRLRAGGGVRLPGAGGAIREPDAAAGDHPDRADVPARGDDRREPARAWTTTS